MEASEKKLIIKQKRDSAVNWHTNNPVLLDGQIGVESDTYKIKIGDGSSHWKDLPYAVIGSGAGTLGSERFNTYIDDSGELHINTAGGEASHVEGYENEMFPTTKYSHVEGKGNVVVTHASHAEGVNNYIGDLGIEAGAHAEGCNNTILDTGSYGVHVEGVGNFARMSASHAEGVGTYAEGYGSHAEGHGFTQSIVLNGITNSKVISDGTDFGFSHTIYRIKTNCTNVDITKCTAIYISAIDKDYMIESIEKNEDDSTKYDIWVIYPSDDEYGLEYLSYNGTSCVAYGGYARGEYSHVEGIGSSAISNASHAEGYMNAVDSLYSHVEGANNYIDGSMASHAEGMNNGIYSLSSSASNHVEGVGNIVSGLHSHVEGSDNESAFNYSHVEGQGNTAKSNNQHIEGMFNEPIADAIHVVGVGTSNSDRKNGYILDKQGNGTYAGSITMNGSDPVVGESKLTEITNELLDKAVIEYSDKRSTLILENAMDGIGFYKLNVYGQSEISVETSPSFNQPVEVVHLGDLQTSGYYNGKYKITITIKKDNTVVSTCDVYLTEPLRGVYSYRFPEYVGNNPITISDTVDIVSKKCIRRVMKKIITGTETISYLSSQSSDTCTVFYTTISDADTKLDIISPQVMYYGYTPDTKLPNMCYRASSNRSRVFFTIDPALVTPETGSIGSNSIKSYLQKINAEGNPLTLYIPHLESNYTTEDVVVSGYLTYDSGSTISVGDNNNADIDVAYFSNKVNPLYDKVSTIVDEKIKDGTVYKLKGSKSMDEICQNNFINSTNIGDVYNIYKDSTGSHSINVSLLSSLYIDSTDEAAGTMECHIYVTDSVTHSVFNVLKENGQSVKLYDYDMTVTGTYLSGGNYITFSTTLSAKPYIEYLETNAGATETNPHPQIEVRVSGLINYTDIKAGDNVVWTGYYWDKLSSTVDLSGYQEKLTIDSELNTVSTNPIQNKAVAEAINAKANSSDLQTLEGTVQDLSDYIGTIESTNDDTVYSAINDNASNITTLSNTIGNPSTTDTEATGIIKDIEELKQSSNWKIVYGGPDEVCVKKNDVGTKIYDEGDIYAAYRKKGSLSWNNAVSHILIRLKYQNNGSGNSSTDFRFSIGYDTDVSTLANTTWCETDLTLTGVEYATLEFEILPGGCLLASIFSNNGTNGKDTVRQIYPKPSNTSDQTTGILTFTKINRLCVTANSDNSDNIRASSFMTIYGK